MKLHGKVALVTGGGSGIGRAAALLFAREGASVCVACRTETSGQETVEAIRSEGGRAVFARTDVRDPDQCRRAVRTTVKELGGLDVLFNNAGIIRRGLSVPDTGVEDWEEIIATNLTGTFLMCRCAVPVMKRGGGGVIVNNASYLGLVGARGVAAYCASKGGVVQLTRAMALDHAKDDIRVNCICPGSVDTAMIEDAIARAADPAEARRSFESKHPLGRVADPDEIARAALYLACDDSSFVTGSCLVVDGGITAG